MADSQHPRPPGRVAGVDYGTRRIGIAISDPTREFASPLEVHQVVNPEADARYFQDLARREQVTRFVVGLPLHLSGHESRKSLEARRFAKWLEQATQLPVELVDERYSTSFADDLLNSAELTKKQRDKRRDMLAAQIILQTYLQGGGLQPPRPLDEQD